MVLFCCSIRLCFSPEEEDEFEFITAYELLDLFCLRFGSFETGLSLSAKPPRAEKVLKSG
jgi:hypothetical protein